MDDFLFPARYGWRGFLTALLAMGLFCASRASFSLPEALLPARGVWRDRLLLLCFAGGLVLAGSSRPVLGVLLLLIPCAAAWCYILASGAALLYRTAWRSSRNRLNEEEAS